MSESLRWLSLCLYGFATIEVQITFPYGILRKSKQNLLKFIQKSHTSSYLLKTFFSKEKFILKKFLFNYKYFSDKN